MKSVVTTRDGIYASSVDNDLIIFDGTAGLYFGAGIIGAAIWQSMGDGKTVGDICNELRSEFLVDEATCKRDVVAFLEDAAQRNLISIA